MEGVTNVFHETVSMSVATHKLTEEILLVQLLAVDMVIVSMQKYCHHLKVVWLQQCIEQKIDL